MDKLECLSDGCSLRTETESQSKFVSNELKSEHMERLSKLGFRVAGESIGEVPAFAFTSGGEGGAITDFGTSAWLDAFGATVNVVVECFCGAS